MGPLEPYGSAGGCFWLFEFKYYTQVILERMLLVGRNLHQPQSQHALAAVATCQCISNLRRQTTLSCNPAANPRYGSYNRDTRGGSLEYSRACNLVQLYPSTSMTIPWTDPDIEIAAPRPLPTRDDRRSPGPDCTHPGALFRHGHSR